MEPDRKNLDNLLHKTNREPFSWRKRLPLVFQTLTVLSALVLGYAYKSFLSGNTPLFPVLLTMGIYLILAGFSTVLSREYSWPARRVKGMVLEALVIMLPFLFSAPLKNVLSAFIIVFLLGLWGIFSSWKSFENATEVRFMRDIRPQFGKVVTALTLAAVILYLPQWQEKQEVVSESVFENFVGSVTSGLVKIYPEFDFNADMSLEAIAQNVALSRLRNNPLFKELPHDSKNVVIRETTEQFLDNIKQSFGESVREEDPLTRVFYNVFVEQIGGMQRRLGGSFDFFWAAILFLLLRGLGVLVSMISAFVALGLYHLFLATKILRIETESVSAERIKFSD